MELTPRHPHIDNQAGLILNQALYNTLENEVQLNTGSGGTGSYVEVRYYPGDVNATHTIELRVSSRRAATYLVWGQGRYEIPLAAGSQVLRVAIPPNGKSGWHGILVGPPHNSGEMLWTLHSVKVTPQSLTFIYMHGGTIAENAANESIRSLAKCCGCTLYLRTADERGFNRAC